MSDPRTVLVVNPQSQSGQLGRKWPDIVGLLRRELGPFEDLRTRGVGDATRLTREALQSGASCVVAVGGDGTISEVAGGFFTDGQSVARDASLGILPFGTGGDFRRTLAIPKNLSHAARIIRAGATRAIDVGKLEYTTRDGEKALRIFANIASFGISGLVDRLVNESPKRLGGRISFLTSTVRATLRYTNQRVHIVFDGDEATSVDMTINTVAVANGRYFGGGMFIAPDAELDDGYFDVVALGDLGIKDLVLQGRRLYRGTHLTMDKVSHCRAKMVYAEPAAPGDRVELDVDGETPGLLPATFTLLPRALSVIVPG
ncbi:MAG: diacylglycerol kinase family lipid kinase [Proteobacteria bacterium]|nr:diacylglycerol kinase family lipid kinase [Pseudomonadota bacterium]